MSNSVLVGVAYDHVIAPRATLFGWQESLSKFCRRLLLLGVSPSSADSALLTDATGTTGFAVVV